MRRERKAVMMVVVIMRMIIVAMFSFHPTLFAVEDQEVHPE